MRKALLAGACLLLWAPAAEARGFEVRSPGNGSSANVRAARGVVTVTALEGGARAFRARIGAGSLAGLEAERRAVRYRFRTPAGKRRVHDVRARVLRLDLPGGRRIEVLVADDGVALRQRGLPEPRFTAPAGSRAWLQRYASNYEGEYRRIAVRRARGEYGYPALISAPTNVWALLSEAGAGAARLIARDGVLRVKSPDRRRGMSPWRYGLIGRLDDIVASSLPLALGRPSRIADPSWIRPGRAAWSWWSDSGSPSRLETQQAYVDAAAARGWEYVLVDEGWDAAWIPDLVRYAADRGVRVLLWSHWRDVSPRALDRWAAWGVAGVKVDFLQSDRRRRLAVYDRIARAAARRRLLVNFHGCTLPRGIQRTWPNVLTMEAVMGAEYAKAGSVPAAHDVNLVFTRNAVGSMDYTPALTARGSTPGHQLALAVAFESGLQHLADTPAAYAAHPAADAALRALPVAWDDTRLLDGSPGSHAIVARRSGEEWWVAGVHAGAAATRTVALGFLAPGRGYRATITGDDPAAREATVTAADTLTVPVSADGGFVVRLVPG